MRVNSFCAACLWDKQLHKSDDPAYLAEVRQIIDTRKDEDTAPYLVYLFTRAYERRFGKSEPYRQVKQKYNDVVLSMENEIRRKIEPVSAETICRPMKPSCFSAEMLPAFFSSRITAEKSSLTSSSWNSFTLHFRRWPCP